jgi:threonyl-tRNA synthetase
MLQRLYGTAWFSQADLDAYLERLEEAKRRDHRKLGKDLELFTISEEVGAGLPLWLPKGATVRRLLEEYILGVERGSGYQHVYTPQLAKLDLYKTSGHWEHYHDSMYTPMKMESGEELVLRQRNCPQHIRCTRCDLPRSSIPSPSRKTADGKSGEPPVSAVRAMTLNDAHIFCTLIRCWMVHQSGEAGPGDVPGTRL